MKRILASVLCSFFLFSLPGCDTDSTDRVSDTDGGQAASTPPATVFVDIASLAGISPEQADSILGPPSSVTPITNDPANMPGEYRDYTLTGATEPLTVRFHKSRAAFVTVYLPFSAPRPEDALARVGLRADDLFHQQTAPAAKWWSGGPFAKIGAITFTDGFNMVQAEFR